jgi:hypothetical protein
MDGLQPKLLPVDSNLWAAKFSVNLNFTSLYRMTVKGLRTGSRVPHPKSKFTQSEDFYLISLVKEHGRNNWAAVAQQMPGRNARQCRDRWISFLSPDIVNGPWTEEEEALLCDEFALLGKSWKQIATKFPGRTDINVKSHWLVMQRRNKHAKQPSPPSLPVVERDADIQGHEESPVEEEELFCTRAFGNDPDPWFPF